MDQVTELKDALLKLAEQISKIAWEMPAPSSHAARLMELSVAAERIVHAGRARRYNRDDSEGK